jgi:hypothetical protein
MTIRSVFKLLFTSVIFLVASDALIEVRAEAGEPPLVLSKNKIGPLKLDGNTTLDLKKLPRRPPKFFHLWPPQIPPP